MTRALIYTRVSSAGQEDDGSSLETQEARCRAYADTHGYTVIATYTDTHTGIQYRERKGLSALRTAIRDGLADVVICYAVDRLSRNQAHLYIIAEDIEDHGARLEFVTEDFEDSAVGRFIRSARAFAAEVEHEKIAERTVRGRIARVQAGKPMAGPTPLYGYHWRDDDKTGMVTNPEAAHVVKRIFVDYANGATLRQISYGLSRDGIPTPRGRPVWGTRTIAEILRNPNYTGNAYGWYPRDKRGAKVNGFDMNEAIALPAGTFPAIVGQHEWNIAQERLRTNKLRAIRNNSDPEGALLRGGFVRCGTCNRSLSVVNGHGRQRTYYRCPPVDRLPGTRCAVQMTAVTLDGLIWQRVERTVLNPRGVNQMVEAFQDTDADTDQVGIERALTDIDRRQSRVAEAIASLNDSDASQPLLAQLAQLSARRKTLQAELHASLAQQSVSHMTRAQMEGIHEWCARVAANLDDLTYTEKREILEWLGVSVRLYPSTHEPRYTASATIPLAIL